MDTFRNEIASTSPTMQGLVVSSVLLPAAIVSFFAGRFADSIGRPRAVTIGASIFGIGATMQAAAIHIAMFIVGRVLSGAGNGIFLSTIVVYICELAPPGSRGVLTSLVQLLTTIGILIGYFMTYGTVHLTSSASWRVPLAVEALLAFIYAGACIPLPQSPRWLTLCGRKEESLALWTRLGLETKNTDLIDGDDCNEGKMTQRAASDMERPTVVVQDSPGGKIEESTEQVSHSITRVFRKDVISRTTLGVFFMTMQQFCGIDSLLYYAPFIFKQAGLADDKAAFLASGVTAIVIVAVTVPGILLADKWRRRTSTVVGGALMAICLILIGTLYASRSVQQTGGAARWVVIVTIFMYIIVYCVTWGVSFRTYPSEIQPPVTRAAATSLAQSINWVSISKWHVLRASLKLTCAGM